MTPANVIDLTDCPVLHPELVRLLDPLRTLLRRMGCVRREASADLHQLGQEARCRGGASEVSTDRQPAVETGRAEEGFPPARLRS